jgi:hypothetical protein
VLDGRELSLCMRVTDKGSHRGLAEQSNLFVVYVDADRKDEPASATSTLQLAAAVTSGTRRGIAVGKRGVFYDRDGREWDAKVNDIIVRPISLWEAAIAPFVRLRDFVMERIEKLTAGKMEALEKGATTKVDPGNVALPAVPVVGAAPATAAPGAAPAAAGAPAAQPAKPAGGGMLGNMPAMLAAGGIAFAAVGSGLAFALNTIASIQLSSAIAAILGVVLAIMALSGFLGWLKLRKRDLSTMLEACGWAVNVRIYLSRRHSLRFTRVPPLPKGSVRELGVIPSVASDEESGRFRTFLLVLGVLVLVALWTLRAPLGDLVGRLVAPLLPPPAPTAPAEPAAPGAVPHG